MNRENHFDVHLLQKYLEQADTDIVDATRDEIELLIPCAMKVFRDILESPDVKPEQKFRAARCIIDMSSIGKEMAQARAPHIVTTMIQQLTPDQLQDLKKNAEDILSNWIDEQETE